jgi:uncharacterized protein YggT (Ycf19 family)
MKDLLLSFIDLAFWLVQLVILAHVIMSWVIMVQRPRWMYHPLVRWVEDTSFRILRPFRQLMAAVGLGRMPIDFSPFVAIIVLQLLVGLLRSIVIRLPIP